MKLLFSLEMGPLNNLQKALLWEETNILEMIVNFLSYRKGTSSAPARRTTGSSPQNMWRFYTEDSPGIKVYVSLTN